MAEGKGDWIKLYRQIKNWEWYKDGNTVRLFVHLLLSVEIRPRQYKGISLEPGQIATNYQELENQTGLTRKQIRGSLEKLKRADCAADLRIGNFLVISILSWDRYQVKGQTLGQSEGRPKGRLGADLGQTKGTAYILNKEIKKKEAAAPQFSPNGDSKGEDREVDEYGFRWG